jgi:chemotaxis protein MotB
LIREKDDLQRDVARCKTNVAKLETGNLHLQQRVNELSTTNAALLNNMGNMVTLSAQEATNLERSLEHIREQDLQIRTLRDAMTKKDSVTLALVVSLKSSLGDLNDTDVTVSVEKGVVFISLSDKMLFKTGSTEISPRAGEVLGKVATVINAKPEMEVLVEGHTDNVPISRECMKDNWDLSVLRATAVTRALTNDHGIDPARITAGGHGEFIPLVPNDTPEHKSINRRTRIVILPRLDEFYKMVESGLKQAAELEE